MPEDVQRQTNGNTSPQHQLRQARLGIRPFVTSAIFAGIYLLICLAYIWYSDQLVSRLASSHEQADAIQTVKGFAFVVLTSLLIFGIAYTLLSRLRQREEQLYQQRLALIESERRALAGLFASSVGHDINNVLVVFRAVIGDDPDAEHPARELTGSDITMLASATEQLTGLAKQLHTIGRNEMRGKLESISLRQCIEDARQLCSKHTQVKHCKVEVEHEDEDVTFQGNPVVVEQMLLNLLINAGEATEGRGHIRIRTEAPDQTICVEVHDDGKGIDTARREKVYAAFYDPKPKGDGGLGLLSVKACAEYHDGEVKLTQSPLGGACFRVCFPRRSGN